MILSIFPKVKPLPTKEEKSEQAWFASKPHYPATLSFSNEDDLIEIITKNAWSPSIYHGYRAQSNFVQTDLMVLDIDDGMRIEEAETMIQNLGIAALCMPSTSHTEEQHRFRLIFPLSRTINDKDIFKSTMEYLAGIFPADPACVGDTARFFFGCRMDDGFWSEGQLLDPIVPVVKPVIVSLTDQGSRDIVSVDSSIEELVTSLFGEKRTKVPEQIAYFLENAHNGLAGEFHNCANSFLFISALMGCEFERIAEVFTIACPDELDSHDTFLLDKATKDGYSKRVEEFEKEDL